MLGVGEKKGRSACYMRGIRAGVLGRGCWTLGTNDVDLHAICEGFGVIRVGILGRVQIRILYFCLIKREKNK